MTSVPTVSACNTCRAAFSSVDKLRDHYRGEWHSFNSKRRANSLAPLSLKEYATVAPLTKPKTLTKSNTADSVSHLPATYLSATNVPETNVPKNGQVKETSTSLDPCYVSSTVIDCKTAEQLARDLTSSFIVNESSSQSERQNMRVPNVGLSGTNEDGDADDWTDDENEDNDINKHGEDPSGDTFLAVEPHISLFDNKIFLGDNGISECIEYMAETFGFFIPDIEFVSDLPGLLIYLGEKVKHGGLCLYCQKQLRPGWPCQNHMVSKSHCKIAYEEEIDLEEYEDFYDFSSLGDTGELEDIEVSNIGELVLPDKTVGHRAYLKYYKQRFRQPDTRPAVLAQQREEIARLGVRFGGLNFNEQQLLKLSYVDISAILAKQHKEATKNTKMQQRAEQKYQYRNNRREYQSTIDKLRSSETTTEKIRDYHKIL